LWASKRFQIRMAAIIRREPAVISSMSHFGMSHGQVAKQVRIVSISMRIQPRSILPEYI
jgi:hypothetical protein